MLSRVPERRVERSHPRGSRGDAGEPPSAAARRGYLIGHSRAPNPAPAAGVLDRRFRHFGDGAVVGRDCSYFAFRDDLLTRLIARQADMQHAYDDRIAELRAQVDRLTSRQLLDQEQVEQRIEQLARRQSALDARAATLSGLPDPSATGSARPRVGARSEASAPAVPKPSPINDTVIIAPAQDRRAGLESRMAAARVTPILPIGRNFAATLGRIEEALDRVEAQQSATLLALEDRYEAKARRMRGVLADLGIDTQKVGAGAMPRGVGGPFVPVTEKAGAFERQLQRIEIARANVDRLTRTISKVPLRKPLTEEIDTSSGYGIRLDPFLRSPAMHSGLDFRAATGEPVRATAAGTVIASGWNGGYGRMVEIDHGNGFSTRYAHLSEILVAEDQTVAPGQIIGRVGSADRPARTCTMTRIDGEAVDPHKFLHAGLRLGEAF